jgi:hypothetical protein
VPPGRRTAAKPGVRGKTVPQRWKFPLIMIPIIAGAMGSVKCPAHFPIDTEPCWLRRSRSQMRPQALLEIID